VTAPCRAQIILIWMGSVVIAIEPKAGQADRSASVKPEVTGYGVTGRLQAAPVR
jgi:hypothetical protein